MKKNSLTFLIVFTCASLHAQVTKQSFSNNNLTLSIETLSDSVLHIQYKKGNASNTAIPVTEMIAKTNYEGSHTAKWNNNILETSMIKLVVNTTTLSFDVIDKTKND